VALAILAGCGGSAVVVQNRSSLSSLAVASSAFVDAGRIPKQYTCDGPGTPPPLEWADPPAATVQLAIVVDDPDAADRPFVHWVVWNLPPSTRALAGALPAGASVGPNSGGGNGWTPPCPPDGTHHYRFRLYALRAAPKVPPGAAAQDVIGAISFAAIGVDQLTGTYSRA
jgi:Raf kinase inhibitor-like YbhB/YbcL family protein